MSTANLDAWTAMLDADIEAHEQQAVILTCGADIALKPVEWLWRDWLALGKFHILAGAPGQGKTTLAVGAMAATVTLGGRWPDDSRCEPGNVVIWSGEDDPNDTLLPRLLAAGGNRSRVFFVQGTDSAHGPRPFDPARDMRKLLAAIDKIGGARLVIVDPVVSAVTGDGNKNTEVRRSLQPLVDAAASGRFAVIGITHFSKGGQGSDPTQRVNGSVAFSAVARVVLVAARVKGEDGEERRILARSKSNIGPDDGGFEYHMEQVEVLPGIEASRVAWGQPVQGSARELLTDNTEAGDEEKSAQECAAEFLVNLLRDGPTPTKTVEAEAKAAGIAWRTVRRASDALYVKKRKTSEGWYWSMSSNPAQAGQGVQPSKGGQVGHLEQLAASGLDEEPF